MKRIILSTSIPILALTLSSSMLENRIPIEGQAIKYMIQFHNSTHQTLLPEYINDQFESTGEQLKFEIIQSLKKEFVLQPANSYNNSGVHFKVSKPVTDSNSDSRTIRLFIVAYFPTGNSAEPFRWDRRDLVMNNVNSEWRITEELKQSGVLTSEMPR